MNRRHRITIAAGAAVLALVFPVSAAFGADATGCSGSVVSMDSSGTQIGTAQAPGEGGTQQDPLPIDPAGVVAWQGSTDAAITNGTWNVTIMGVNALSGTFDNAEAATSAEGVQDLSTLATPLAWVLQGDMVVPISGAITGTGGTCTASGFITGTGAPTSAPMFYTGAAFLFLGLVMVFTLLFATKATGAGVAGVTAAAGEKV